MFHRTPAGSVLAAFENRMAERKRKRLQRETVRRLSGVKVAV